MPSISRFFGIVIGMFAEFGGQHHLPHFHVRYQEHKAVFGIAPLVLLAGSLPLKQRRLVEAWAEIHQEELLENWKKLSTGMLPSPVPPLH